MTDFNQATILGNITRDPEFRVIPSGQAVISFSVATNRRWTTADGAQQEDTQYHNVVAWGKLAEICQKILYKGRKVLVVGRLKTRNWEGQDGIKRYTTEIVADHISATGAPKAAGEETIANQPTQTQTTKPTQTTTATEEVKPVEKKEDKADDINLDDIPF
jgi:single-strand DNA-binding protein